VHLDSLSSPLSLALWQSSVIVHLRQLEPCLADYGLAADHERLEFAVARPYWEGREQPFLFPLYANVRLRFPWVWVVGDMRG
jgi:hypothetical protein